MRWCRCVVLYLCCAVIFAQEEPVWKQEHIFPIWHRVQPKTTSTHQYQAMWNAAQNGEALRQRIAKLVAGEGLLIEAGRYEVNAFWNLSLNGTADKPIWIMAAKDSRVIFTRKDNAQNVLNIARARYLCLKGIEFTGGSSLLRLYDCEQVWIDRCYLHHGGNVGITANTADTNYLYITRNHIEAPGVASSTSEGMYLGANEGKVVMRNSVIAFNKVHNCRGTQGDGIEVKQGSYDNWIVGNHIFDCDYPCLTIYGSNGKGTNVVEGNLCYRSKNHAIQIQGDAIVRNNIALAAGGAAFYTRDHQGSVDILQVYHNTFVNNENAVELRNWNNKSDMIFANNACYSSEGLAVKVVDGSAGARIGGNVYFGALEQFPGTNKQSKQGLKDFANLSADGEFRDARPTKSSALLKAGDPGLGLAFDFYRLERGTKPSVGAVAQRVLDIRRLLMKAFKIKYKNKRMPAYNERTWLSEEPGPAWEFFDHTYKKEPRVIWWPPLQQ